MPWRCDGAITDRLWIWCHPEGTSNGPTWGVPGSSRMTPAEGALYLDVPNVIMVRYGSPELWTPERRHQYALSLRPMRNVVWSIVGPGGSGEDAEREQTLDLARRHRHITGVIMDDFFTEVRRGGEAAMSEKQLAAFRKRLVLPDRRLDLWVVLYDIELHLDLSRYLRHCDMITYWTLKSPDLVNLEANFTRARAMAPDKDWLLGVYLWDYGLKAPMPVELVRRQCELGAQWLRAGQLAGMIFLGSCVADLELPAVEWVRQWVQTLQGRS